MRIDGTYVFEVEEYEYKIQLLDRDGEWRNTWTNQFDSDVWYPNYKSAKNALAQLRATRWGQPSRYEYRMIKRPYGKSEEVPG